MGISTYGCEQLYQVLVNKFLAVDGDINWIDIGMDAVPDKLKSLIDICKLIAT